MMKLSVIDACPAGGSGATYFVNVDPSKERVSAVKRQVESHPFVKITMKGGEGAAGNQHLFCRGNGDEELDDGKVLSEYGFGLGGSTELVVAFGKMDEEKAARVKDKIGGGQDEWLAVVIAYGKQREQFVFKPDHPLHFVKMGIYNDTQIPQERQLLTLDGRPLLDEAGTLGENGLYNGCTVVVGDKMDRGGGGGGGGRGEESGCCCVS